MIRTELRDLQRILKAYEVTIINEADEKNTGSFNLDDLNGNLILIDQHV